MSSFIQYNNLYFLTSTIHQWQPLLRSVNRKEIVCDCLSYMTDQKRMIIYAFVILDNHFHLIYEAIPPDTSTTIKHSILSYSATQLKTTLSDEEQPFFLVVKKNKTQQIWKPDSLTIELKSERFFKQKFHYVHKNVVRAGFDERTYQYSSVPSYLDGRSKFEFLTLWG